MAAYIDADIAKAIQSPDGAFKIEFLRRNDGLYEYRGFERRLEESPAGSDHYWLALPDDGRARRGGAADGGLAAGNA
jgi:hypothetical protein